MSDDEEVKLMPMDPKDRPKKVKSLQTIIRILGNSSEARDWNNLPAFLEGMVMAKEKLPEGWLEKVVRKANEQHKTGLIVRCAEMVEKTGVTLADSPITEELMLGFHIHAIQAGWNSEEAAKAAKRADQVALMMESKEHCGGKLQEGQEDMRRSLAVVGVLLELAAAREIHRDCGEDLNGKVTRYARNVVLLCEKANIQVSNDWRNTARRLERWIPLRAGLKMASDIPSIKKSDLAKKIAEQITRIDDAMEKAKAQVEEQAAGKPKRCLNMLKEIEAM